MLVKFALELDAIDDSTTRAYSRRLIRGWELFGVLVYPSPSDIKERTENVRLVPAAKALWKATWKQAKKYPRRYRYSPPYDGSGFAFSDIQEPGDLARHHEFEVAVLEETRALELAIPEGEGKLFGEVEGVRLCDIDESQKFQRSSQLSQELVRIDKSVKVLWQERFQRFAEHSQNVVIFDRFAVRDDGNQNIQGLFKLLDFLDKYANGCEIVIYSSLATATPNSIKAEVDSIKTKLESKIDGLNSNGIKSVEVHLFHDDTFRRPGHDRYIRFNDNIFSIGIGVELFRHPSVKQAMDCKQAVLKSDKPEYRTRQLDNSKNGKIANFTIPVGTSAT